MRERGRRKLSFSGSHSQKNLIWKMKSKKITKNDTIEEAIKKNPRAKEIFFKEGLVCIDCPMAQYETIEQGYSLHGIDTNKMLKKLNKK